MKYLAILGDSLRETIDSKVCSLSSGRSRYWQSSHGHRVVHADPRGRGSPENHRPLSRRLKEVDLHLGRTKATPAFTQFSVEDVKIPENAPKPWEAEYQFVHRGSGTRCRWRTRMVVLQQAVQTEEEEERTRKTWRKTAASSRKISRKKPKHPGTRTGSRPEEAQRQIMDRLMALRQERPRSRHSTARWSDSSRIRWRSRATGRSRR